MKNETHTEIGGNQKKKKMTPIRKIIKPRPQVWLRYLTFYYEINIKQLEF